MEKLSPPNPLPHLVLAPLDQPSSTRANAHGAIHKVFPHGIQFIDQMAMVEGFLAMIFGGGAVVSFFFFYLDITTATFSNSSFMMLGFTLIFIIGSRPDFVGYRYQPVLFNKAQGKVHVFLDEGTRLWEVWRWFGWTKHGIHTYDWACVRAEVAQITVLGHANLPRHEMLLMLAFTEAPGSSNVVARVGVGYTDAYVGTEAAEQRFEHIRRYMQMQGPPLVQGDQLYSDPSRLSVWGAFTWGQPLIGPGSLDYWTGRALGSTRRWPWTVIFGLACLPLLPLTVPGSFLRALSHWSKRTPKWPPEILASVGGAELPASEVVTPMPRRLTRPPAKYGPAPKQLTLKQRRAAERERKRKALG